MTDNIPSINSLHREKAIKEISRNELYSIVLNKCVEKIIFANKNTDKTYIIFEVPKILIGQPNYDMNACIIYIINKLTKKCYKADFIEPYYLRIDWSSSSSNEKKTLNDKINNVIKTENPAKLSAQTKALLSQFPDTSKIEFVYEDQDSKKKPIAKRNVRNKKKK